jgi:peptide/nickel transport system permease protein
MALLRLIVRRLASAALLLVGASVLMFAVVDLAPSDPILARFGIQAAALTPDQLAQARERLGLNDSLPSRYAHFVGGVFHGDLGASARTGQAISVQLRNALPVTLSLAALAALVAAVLALTLGGTAALFQGRWPDRLITGTSALWLAAPPFWVALLAINLFSIRLGWFPPGGYQPIAAGPGPWLRALVLPALTLGIGIAGVLVRVVRASVVEQLGRDYVRTALGAGVRPSVVLWRNVLPNALASPLAVFGLYVGYLLAGAVLVEVVYALPGIGQLLVNAAVDGDIAVARIVALVTVALFLVANLIADVAAAALDPRRAG